MVAELLIVLLRAVCVLAAFCLFCCKRCIVNYVSMCSDVYMSAGTYGVQKRIWEPPDMGARNQTLRAASTLHC